MQRVSLSKEKKHLIARLGKIHTRYYFPYAAANCLLWPIWGVCAACSFQDGTWRSLVVPTTGLLVTKYSQHKIDEEMEDYVTTVVTEDMGSPAMLEVERRVLIEENKP